MELKSKHKQIQSWFFSKERLPINLNFKMNNMELEIVSEFIHLGTMFQRTGSFKKNKVNLLYFDLIILIADLISVVHTFNFGFAS